MNAALLVDRAANPRTIAGQNGPEIGKLSAGASINLATAAPLAPATSSIVILSAMLPT